MNATVNYANHTANINANFSEPKNWGMMCLHACAWRFYSNGKDLKPDKPWGRQEADSFPSSSATVSVLGSDP